MADAERETLDLDVLTAALTEIHRRHEILRTTFPFENGEPVQRIGGLEPVTIRWLEREEDAWKAVEEPFDLAARPAVRHLLSAHGAYDVQTASDLAGLERISSARFGAV